MEILFEFIRVGSIMRVTAVDPRTGTEAVIQGPVNLSQTLLQKTAARKLHYILNKQKNSTDKV